jgi:hypothetical protein
MISISNTYLLLCRPLLGTIASSGHVHKCPEKSPKSKVLAVGVSTRIRSNSLQLTVSDGIFDGIETDK